MPQAKGMRHFQNGILKMASNQWTGQESKQLLVQFFPAVVSRLLAEQRMLVHALVDFMYQAQVVSLTKSNLKAMDNNLVTFHKLKELLVGPVYKSKDWFNEIAKLHMLQHWTHLIRELGTPDGFNTEGPEHLHIEYAKLPWQASNKRKPEPQMIK